MINLYMELSKYLILLLTVLDTYCNFRYFSIADEEKRKAYLSLQQKIILLLHFIAFSVFVFKTEDLAYLKLYGAQLLFFLLYPRLFRVFCRRASGLLLNNVCFFLALGLIMLTRLSYSHALKQFAIVCAAAAVTLPVPLLVSRMRCLARGYGIFFALGFALLFSVFAAGSVSYGAKMTLSAGGISFQPSELAKLTFVFFAAGMLQKSLEWKNIVVTSVLAALHVLILIACRDLGTGLLFFTAYVAMLYTATGRAAYAAAGAGAFSAAGVISCRLFSHVRTRIAAWRDPWSDIAGGGYQIAHSLFAIGTGGWVGAGLMQGLPNKIPVVEKDFIFSAISEELGAVTALCLVLTCLGCFLQMMMTALDTDDFFRKTTVVGLSVIYIVQVFLTVGGAVKFIPSTGITLPFVSYGGSSVVGSFLLFAVIQGFNLCEASEERSNSGSGSCAEKKLGRRFRIRKNKDEQNAAATGGSADEEADGEEYFEDSDKPDEKS